MIHLKQIILFLALITILTSCGITKDLPSLKAGKLKYNTLSTDDKKLADSLVKYVLDNEGLYTVISGLKPVSSVTNLGLMIGSKDTLSRGERNVTDIDTEDYQELLRYQRVVDALQFGDLNFLISPYKIPDKDEKVLQITVYRQHLIDSLLAANPEFYGQFGFAPGTDGKLVINTTEYEEKYARFRSYGYLFGYPEHAVTFFVEASITNDQENEFVKRDFYQIPVFSGKQGHFVYALPKDSSHGPADVSISSRATDALTKYREVRKDYQRSDGSLEAYKLLRHLIKKDGKK